MKLIRAVGTVALVLALSGCDTGSGNAPLSELEYQILPPGIPHATTVKEVFKSSDPIALLIVNPNAAPPNVVVLG
ncbi:MAG TPA: hypothetical protein VEJ86_07610, partial [Candidatus Binataceae bacterium]|nr:hypothetical protein [Candidatus Binataceae bacterium]